MTINQFPLSARSCNSNGSQVCISSQGFVHLTSSVPRLFINIILTYTPSLTLQLLRVLSHIFAYCKIPPFLQPIWDTGRVRRYPRKEGGPPTRNLYPRTRTTHPGNRQTETDKQMAQEQASLSFRRGLPGASWCRHTRTLTTALSPGAGACPLAV